MFFCNKCAREFFKCDSYISHIKLFHNHDVCFKYVCGFNRCPVTLSSFYLFKKHLFHHEELRPNNNNLKMVCSCGFKSYLKVKFLSHFKQHSKLVCPIKDCDKVYNLYSSFSSHISKYHPSFKTTDLKSDILTNVPNDSPSEIPVQPSTINPSCETSSGSFDIAICSEKCDIRKNISLFVIQMQEKFLLPESVISELISGMSQLHDDSIELFKHRVIDCLKRNCVGDSILKYVSDLPSSNAVKSTYHAMTSSHLKSKFMGSIGLVEPVEYKLGNILRKSATFQYVPMLKNLKAFIKNTDVLHYVLTKPNSDNAILRDIYFI